MGDPQGGRATEVLDHPVLGRGRLGVGEVACTEHGDEQLHAPPLTQGSPPQARAGVVELVGRSFSSLTAEIEPGSVTRARLELMHWIGMRPSQMGRLRAEDFGLDEPTPLRRCPAPEGQPDRRRPARAGRRRRRQRRP